MSYNDIKGQDFVVNFFKRAKSNNKLAQAYLFHGPFGVGKELVAKTFAKVLNCEKLDNDSCDVCNSCMRIDKKEYPDVTWFYPEGASRSIKIEQVRNIQKFMSWKAFEGRFKVCIIVDAETLTIEAGNALLKILEEPPANAVFILISSLPETVLQTIKSRSQAIQFSNLNIDIVKKILCEKQDIAKEEIELLSYLSFGSVGRALELRDKDVSFRRKLILDVLAKGSFKDMIELMAKVNEINESLKSYKENLAIQLRQKNGSIYAKNKDAYIAGKYRGQVEEVLNLIKGWYRDILVYRITEKNDYLFNKDYLNKISYWKSKIELPKLEEKLSIIDDFKDLLKKNISLKMLLQILFIKLELIL